MGDARLVRDRRLPQFYWVSGSERAHSRNLAARPELGIVIYDSSVPVGGAQAVYMAAVAEEVADDGIEVFARRSEAQGLRPWTSEDVLPPARHRLYRATAGEHFVLAGATSGCRSEP